MDESKERNIKATIGIGVTTTPNRKYLLDQWLTNFRLNTKEPYHLHVHRDEFYNGVAYSKNENLRALKSCDYVFLFDDDCFPISENWTQFFIDSGYKHLLYLNEKLHGKPNNEVYQNCGGVFMFMTKDVIEKVGAFDEKFNPYGFEHADYSNRIYGKRHHYISLKDTDKYLRALDYEGNNKSSITMAEKTNYVQNNWNKYFKEPTKQYIPL